MPVNVEELGIDLLACSAHKFYGPKGVGALYVRRRDPRVSLSAQIHGGGHERGLRSGTLNVPGIVGMGHAAQLALKLMDAETSRLIALRDELEGAILSIGGVMLNSDPSRRLPHVGNYSFEGVQGDALLRALTRELAVSSGSACTSALPEPSYVLRALGRSDELASAAIRIALGRSTTTEDIRQAQSIIRENVLKLREQGHYVAGNSGL